MEHYNYTIVCYYFWDYIVNLITRQEIKQLNVRSQITNHEA